MRHDYLRSIAAGALTGIVLALTGIYFAKSYGVVLFWAVPLAMGFVASAVLAIGGPRRLLDSMLCTFAAALVASLGFLVAGLEGFICILMAIPLAAPFLAIGALSGYFAFHRKRYPPVISTVIVLMVAALAVIEVRVRHEPPVNVVEDSVIVHAGAADVWSAIIALDDVPAPADWMYRAGLACPQKTRIESGRAGGRRVCTLSTGQLVEQIEVWRPGRLLRWHSRSTPPPMRETNPFHAAVDPPHLHGYYDSPLGEFALDSLGPNLTRLTRRTWYSQRLYPLFYWDALCEAGISQIHRTVLEHVRDTVEARRRIGLRT